MKTTSYRPYSRYAGTAVCTLGKHIKATRLERRITMQSLCERACVSRAFLRRLENGDPSCNIGSAFEIAALLGLPLFQSDYRELTFKEAIAEEKLTILPSRSRQRKIKVDDDF